MKVLFIVPYPTGEAPSQRFRFEQYFDALRQKGIQFRVSPFLDLKAWNIIYQKGRIAAKAAGMLRGFLRRLGDVLISVRYDYVFIHREAAPLGPPLFEWLIAKVLSRKIIYDFDDAIWLPNVSESNRFFSRIKWYGKVSSICRWAHIVSCGNDFLKQYALQYGRSAVVNPTVVETNRHYNKLKEHKKTGRIIIGWTGTHSTVRYLNDLLPVLKIIEERYDAEIRIISNAEPRLPLKNINYVPWNKSTEIEDLLAFDIGIMPLPDNEWAKGKCGFKLIQYLALGIPAISSQVGVNPEIIDEGANGFLCSTQEQWLMAFEELISNPEKRKQYGRNGRMKVVSHFSAVANSASFLSMFA
jgi:glycosyltransferase involved in cell wall biosynthesis